MQTISVLLVSVVLAVCASNLASSYKIDYTNGHNKIHFENNRLVNGKPVNEPSVEEAIKTLSRLGFKPDNARVLNENEQMEQQRQEMIHRQQQHQQGNPQMMHPTQHQAFQQHQQALQQQQQQFLQHQQQLHMQKRMPNVGPREGVVNLSSRQRGKNTEAAKAAETTETAADAAKPKISELQELAGVKPSFQPTLDSITNQNQNNKAYEKLMSMRTYLPYFKAKYGLGDDFVDPIDEQIEEQNEMMAIPLLYNAARNQAHNKNAEGAQEPAVRPLSAMNYGNGGYQDSYQQVQVPYNGQNNYKPPQQNYIPQYVPQPPQVRPAYVAPVKESYSTSDADDQETSDIFITNINENYNNLNNTQTENTIAKSNNADRNYNRNDDKSTYKTGGYA